MELRQLRYFVAVAEELHFGRAAERLMIVQSAVSQQVRRLERELGVDLLDRSPRHVRLTEAGARFLPHAHAVLEAEQRAVAAVADFAVHSGPLGAVLRIGTSTGMGEHLERFLEAMGVQAPGTRIELSSGPTAARLEQVATGQLDACFVRGVEQGPDGVRLIPVWQDELVVAISARHPLAEREAVQLRDLADLPLLLTARRYNPPLVDLITGACRDAGFEPVPGPVHSSLQDTLAAFGQARRAGRCSTRRTRGNWRRVASNIYRWGSRGTRRTPEMRHCAFPRSSPCGSRCREYGCCRCWPRAGRAGGRPKHGSRPQAPADLLQRGGVRSEAAPLSDCMIGVVSTW